MALGKFSFAFVMSANCDMACGTCLVSQSSVSLPKNSSTWWMFIFLEMSGIILPWLRPNSEPTSSSPCLLSSQCPCFPDITMLLLANIFEY